MLTFSFWQNPLHWGIFLAGLCFGSFFNVCIFRIPEGTFWKTHRSHCRSCQSPIAAYDNIPLLSFLWLRGKSRCCGTRLSWQYPLVELLTGLAFIMLFLRFPFLSNLNGENTVFPPDMIRFIHGIIFVSFLIICSFIDLRLRIIPDVLSLPMIALAPIMVYWHPDLTLKSSLFGILAGGGSVYLVAWIYVLIRKEEGIGMGDAKLLAAIGGWLGVESIFPTFFYGSLIGSVVGLSVMAATKQRDLKLEIPFGPFLAMGCLLHYVYGSQLLGWFMGA